MSEPTSRFSSHCEDQRDGALHLLVGDRLAVDLEDAGAAAADAAHAVEGERAHAEPVVLEVELERVLAGRQRLGALPADALQIDQVPQ